eukprot:gb/GECG01014534.1/.p1 GENE.gb/GECG01014534.1/~~gb/GECG01014534.1/.p1  ORF type:complete len:516 (+),score=75.02 gb/GECG01014534.1/:1-1548(+)
MDVYSPEQAEIQRWRKKALRYSYLHKQYTRAWRKLSKRIEELAQDNIQKEREIERLLEALRAILPQLCSHTEENSRDDVEDKLKEILDNRLFCAIGIPHRLPECKQHDSTQTTVEEQNSPSKTQTQTRASPSDNTYRKRNNKRPSPSNRTQGEANTSAQLNREEQQSSDSAGRRTTPLKLAKVEADDEDDAIVITESQTSNEENTDDDNGPVSANVLPERRDTLTTDGSEAGEEMQSQHSEDCANPGRNFRKQYEEHRELVSSGSSTQTGNGAYQPSSEATQKTHRPGRGSTGTIPTRSHTAEGSTQSPSYHWGTHSSTEYRKTSAEAIVVDHSEPCAGPDRKVPPHLKQTATSSLRARLGKAKNAAPTTTFPTTVTAAVSESITRTTMPQPSQNSISENEESIRLMAELGNCDFEQDDASVTVPTRDDTEATSSSKPRGEPSHRYTEVVRNRDEREAMRGFNCDQCRQFYANLGSKELEEAAVQCSSRHRHHHTPPSTPDGYWENLWIGSPSQR